MRKSAGEDRVKWLLQLRNEYDFVGKHHQIFIWDKQWLTGQWILAPKSGIVCEVNGECTTRFPVMPGSTITLVLLLMSTAL